MSKKSLIILMIFSMSLPLSLFAEEPEFYMKKDTWEGTLWSSILSLEKMKKSGQVGWGTPDFGGSDFTFMVWVKTTESRSCMYAKVSRQTDRPEMQGKVIYIDYGIPHYQVESIGTFSSGKTINDGKWHHIALTGGDPHEFYIDGVKVKEMTLDPESLLNPDNSELGVRLGFSQWGVPFKRRVSFDGILDELKLYNRKLSKDEIANSYKNDMTVKNGLSGWWRFEEAVEKEEGVYAVDESENQNYGEIYNCEITSGKVGNGLSFSGKTATCMCGVRPG